MSGSTLTGSFSAKGRSSVIYVPAGETLTYALSVTDTESFIGTVALQRSVTGAQTWETLTSWTGTEGSPLEDAAASGTLRSPGAHYRFACLAFDEASDAIAWTLSDTIERLYKAELVDGKIQNKDGETILEVQEDGIVARKLTATGATTLGATTVGTVTLAAQDANGLPAILASGAATSDATIVAQVGADALWADGSLYVSVVDGAGTLWQKRNDVWVELTA